MKPPPQNMHAKSRDTFDGTVIAWTFWIPGFHNCGLDCTVLAACRTADHSAGNFPNRVRDGEMVHFSRPSTWKPSTDLVGTVSFQSLLRKSMLRFSQWGADTLSDKRGIIGTRVGKLEDKKQKAGQASCVHIPNRFNHLASLHAFSRKRRYEVGRSFERRSMTFLF